MPTFRLHIAFDGTDFVGWQRQPKRRTVQGELEAAFKKVTLRDVHCISSGRTDAGVHALFQVVCVEVQTRLTCAELTKALNAELPEDILVFESKLTHHGFHPIREAVRKRYRYLLEDGQMRDLWGRNYLWHLFKPLDVEAMHRAAQGLVGTHDFKTYQSHGSMRLTTVRTIYDIVVERRKYELTDRIVVEVEADGFLYNMVRNIVGTLVMVGHGRFTETWPVEALALRDRRRVGMTAPAQGLYLLNVWYDESPGEHPVNPDAEMEPDGAPEAVEEVVEE